MSLLWTPVHSIANWTAPPAPPRVARAALIGQGWLVATEVAGGWSTTFVPDAGAANPPDGAVVSGFQAAGVDWNPPVEAPTAEATPSQRGGKEPRSTPRKATTKTSR